MSPDNFPSLVDLRVGEFLARLAEPQPAPGGGSAAALAGALAAGLIEMVAAVTLARQHDEELRAEMIRVREGAARLQARLAALVNEDAAAYARLSSAYRLPRGSEAERSARREAIQGAAYGAVAVPLATAELCLDVLGAAETAARAGNALTVPDAAMAALLAHAALQGSVRNAAANLATVRDPAMHTQMQEHAARLDAEGRAALAVALQAADSRG